MTEVANPEPFRMFGARDIMSRTGIRSVIGAQVSAIEGSIDSVPELVFDLSRALVETVCKTILNERGRPIPSGMNDLLKATYSVLNMVPVSSGEKHDTEGKIQELVDAFNSVIGCVTHLRMKFGISSHGKSGPYSAPDAALAILAARSADAVVHYLYLAHKNYLKEVDEDALELIDNEDFNAELDLEHGSIELLGQTYRYSEVVFMVDRELYKTELLAFRAGDAPEDEL